MDDVWAGHSVQAHFLKKTFFSGVTHAAINADSKIVLGRFYKIQYYFKFAPMLCLWHLWQEPTCYETYHKTQKFPKTSRNFFNFAYYQPI